MIWCDLDNTLIWTSDPLITTPLLSAAYGLPIESRPPCGKGLRRLARVHVPELGTGYACCRKKARPFLASLRRVDRVCMLTSALRCYAIAMNEAFGFGFAGSEIVTRENLQDGKTINVDMRALLIDNEPRYLCDHDHDLSRARKLRYLGISSKSVLEVPYFHGQTSDPFDSLWRDYAAEIAQRVRNRT